MIALLKRLVRDENGAEVLDYALVVGLVVLVAIGVISQLGNRVNLRWMSVNSGMDNGTYGN